MNKSILKTLIDTRQFPDEKCMDEVIGLAEAHPYCSGFQVLKAIGARQFDRLDSKEQLNLASVYINDRAKLYTYTVRVKLLEHIASSEQAATEVATAAEVVTEFQVDSEKKILADASDIEEKIAASSDAIKPIASTEREDANSIQSAPLEARILIEAMGHLGEMEVSTSLSALANEKLTSQPESTLWAEQATAIDTSQYSSFTQWLLKKGTAANKEIEPNTQAEQLIIDKFIQESPQISPAKAAFFSPSQMGKLSLVEDESFVSETLAKIYERQGDFKKAARAYKQLGLKYPEKRSYFAALEKGAESQLKN